MVAHAARGMEPFSSLLENAVFDIGVAFPTRRRILELLRAGDMTAGELAEHFRHQQTIAQPSSGDAQERRSCNGRTAWAEHRV